MGISGVSGWVRAIGGVLLWAALRGGAGAQDLPIHRFDFDGGALSDSGSAAGADLAVAAAGGGGATTPTAKSSVTDGLGVERRDAMRLAGGATDFSYLKVDAPDFTLPVFTVTLWARTDAVNQGDYKGLFSSGEAVSGGFQIDNHQSDYRILGIDNGLDLPLGSVVPDRWQHLAVTYDGNVLRAYLDGEATGSAAGNPGTAFRVIAFGSNRGINHGFGGDVDDLRLYDRALGALEIAEFMQEATPRPTSGTLTEPFVVKLGGVTVPIVENPRRMTPEADGTGFTWGGFNQATAATAVAVAVVAHTSRLVFEGSGDGDDEAAANYRGSYAYTVFDPRGGVSATRVVPFATILLEPGGAAAGQRVRWLIRDNGARWFLSREATDVAADTVTTAGVSAMAWLRVDLAAEAEMNELDADAQTPIADPASLDPEAPDLTFLTGGGLYIESGDTNPGARQDLEIDQMAWIAGEETDPPNPNAPKAASDAVWILY